MRCILRRGRPSPHLELALRAKSASVSSGELGAEEAWRRFSKSAAYGDLRTFLSDEAGSRERCYYCSDSLGNDVEHFFPKSDYPERCFDLENLLLVCAGCNRAKGKRFPLAEDGSPLLINPVLDDPWDALFFDDYTGLITPRIHRSDSGQYIDNSLGAATLDILDKSMNRGTVAEGRTRTWQLLLDEFTKLFDKVRYVTEYDLVSIARLDDYGLIDWMLLKEGAQSPNVRALRLEHPAFWRSIVAEWEQVRRSR